MIAVNDPKIDAVAWIAHAPHLVPLVDRRVAEDAVLSRRLGLTEWRRAKQNPEETYEGLVVPGAPAYANTFLGCQPYVVTTTGEIAFHIDDGFPAYSMLFIVRPGGCNVTGGLDWRGDHRQRAGDIIMLRAQRHHALVQRGADESWFRYESDRTVSYDRPPARVWVALTIDTNEFFLPDQGLALYEGALGYAR